MSEIDNASAQERTGSDAAIKLDVNVRPITPRNNLLAFASIKMNDCFVVDGIKVVAGEKGLFVDMPSVQDSKGTYHDVCFPITSDFRKELQTAVLDKYAVAVEKVQAVGAAQREFTQKPGIMEQLNAGKEKAAAMPQRESAAKTPGAEL